MDREANVHGASCRASSSECGYLVREATPSIHLYVAFEITVVTGLERFNACFFHLARVRNSE